MKEGRQKTGSQGPIRLTTAFGKTQESVIKKAIAGHIQKYKAIK